MLRYDHYKLLGVARDATLMQIKRAYRARVKSCHPDVNPSPRAAKAFRAVHEAYNVLTDPRRKRYYDEELRFYKQASMSPVEEPVDVRKYGYRRAGNSFKADNSDQEAPSCTMDKVVFMGLHLTGLLFGLALLSGILVGITMYEWPVATLFFSTMGIAVIPDSISGLRIGIARHGS